MLCRHPLGGSCFRCLTKDLSRTRPLRSVKTEELGGESTVAKSLKSMINRFVASCLGLGMVAASLATAQDIPAPAPPKSVLYSTENHVGDESITQEMIPEDAIIEGPKYQTITSAITDELTLHTDMQPLLESTGTWFRRGLWYMDIDAVVLTRTWDSDGRRLMFDSSINDERLLTRDRKLGESSPDADGSARIALGRFLFRDTKNRDHTAEMVVLGGAEWVDQGSIEASVFPLLVPNELTGGVFPNTLPSFNLANESSYSYSSHFNSFEWNYNVTQRMRKDQMELTPSGTWVRKASPGWTQSYLAGLRYFELQEDFDWLASDIVSIGAGVSGEMNVRTSNNLFGVQFGHGLTYETDRWNVSLFSKHGMYVNDARSTHDLTFANSPNGTADNFSNEGHENSLNYLLQAGVTGRYHIRPNISLRVGYELMYLTGLALAPNEISFDGTQALAGTTGDVFYRGFTFGSEFFW